MDGCGSAEIDGCASSGSCLIEMLVLLSCSVEDGSTPNGQHERRVSVFGSFVCCEALQVILLSKAA